MSTTSEPPDNETNANAIALLAPDLLLIGTAGPDVLVGAPADDTIKGKGGDDQLFGSGGNDTLYGQVGDDILEGGMGNDTLDGGTHTGGSGDTAAFDQLNAAVLVDLLAGFAFGQGVDTLMGFESIRGSNLSDSLGGNNVRNRIEGLDGNDHMYGRQGDDTMIGGKGRDVIMGGADDDTLIGGANADTLNGGGGNDTFDYNAIGDSGTVASTRDVIESFVQGGAGGDVFDFNSIDAQASVGGNQDFTFIGAAAFSAEGQIRFSNAGGHTFIEVNTSGATGTDMSIALLGTFTMTGADFIT